MSPAVRDREYQIHLLYFLVDREHRRTERPRVAGQLRRTGHGRETEGKQHKQQRRAIDRITGESLGFAVLAWSAEPATRGLFLHGPSFQSALDAAYVRW